VNEKTRSYVEPIARTLEAPIFMQLDVAVPGQLEAVFERIDREWGCLDVVVHSIAGGAGDDLRGPLVDCSAVAFRKAMDVSVHSFVRIARLAAPLMRDGGTMLAMTYIGAQTVVPNYDVMGPVKAALESTCRYLAYELSPRHIRVHAISPGPLHTRASKGLKDFDRIRDDAARRAPLGATIDIMDVGYACAYLATPHARRMTGSTLYVDSGANIMA
jgi:enoyl-[acyl-carrier protein] reductase I